MARKATPVKLFRPMPGSGDCESTLDPDEVVCQIAAPPGRTPTCGGLDEHGPNHDREWKCWIEGETVSTRWGPRP